MGTAIVWLFRALDILSVVLIGLKVAKKWGWWGLIEVLARVLATEEKAVQSLLPRVEAKRQAMKGVKGDRTER